MRKSLFLLGLAVLIYLAGCGGGGGVGPAPPSAPIIQAANRQWTGTADALSQETQLVWGAVRGATGYNVYMRPEGSTLQQIAKNLKDTIWTHTISDDNLDKKIYYSVSAVGPGGESSRSKEVETSPPSLSAPQNLQADRKWVGQADTLSQQVVLTWEAWRAARATTTYKVYRNGSYLEEVSDLSFTDNVPNDLLSQNITYKVSACVQGVEGPSTEITTTPPPLSAPQNLAIERHWTGTGDNVAQEAVITWENWRTRQISTTYKIYRNNSPIAEVQTTSYTDQLPPELWNKDLTYKVSAYIPGFSEESVEKTSSPPSLAIPQNLTADRHWEGPATDPYQVTELTWSEVTGATCYNVYMQAEGQGLIGIKQKITGTSYTHTIPSDLWTSNIDYFVSAYNEDANMEGEKAKVHTDANQVGPPPNPLRKGRSK